MREWREIERFPGSPAAGYEYRLDGDEPGFSVEVRPAFAIDAAEHDLWDLTLRGCGVPTIQEIGPRDFALRLGRRLYVELLPQHRSANARRRERQKADAIERAERDEVERPAREKGAREREERLREAPVEDAGKCPECGHVDELDEFDERGYECGQDGSTGRGEEGRRCDQCNKFRARVSDLSCPSCEAPLEEVATVPVKRDGGELIEVEPGDDGVDGYSWASTGQIRSRDHIAKVEPYQTVAICGVGIAGTVETRPITLNLCPGCAREARRLGFDPTRVGLENDLV